MLEVLYARGVLRRTEIPNSGGKTGAVLGEIYDRFIIGESTTIDINKTLAIRQGLVCLCGREVVISYYWKNGFVVKSVTDLTSINKGSQPKGFGGVIDSLLTVSPMNFGPHLK